MKKIFKTKIMFMFIGMIITFGITTAFAYSFAAQNIEFNPSGDPWEKDDETNVSNVSEALDYLYSQTNSFIEFTKPICIYQSETSYADKNQIGASYNCRVGNNLFYNFYILAIKEKDLDLIMDRNYNNESMNWYTAMKYIKTNNLKNLWSNVLDVNLPGIQDIANASGRTDWYMEDQSYNGRFYMDKTKSKFLFNYLNGCASYGCDIQTTSGASGYWTRDTVSRLLDSNARSWIVQNDAYLNTPYPTTSYGIRPTITILRSQLK